MDSEIGGAAAHGGEDESFRARWESSTRFYNTTVHRDLLGDLVLLQQWGGRFNALGSQRTLLMHSSEEAVAMIDSISRLRKQHGYSRVL